MKDRKGRRGQKEATAAVGKIVAGSPVMEVVAGFPMVEMSADLVVVLRVGVAQRTGGEIAPPESAEPAAGREDRRATEDSNPISPGIDQAAADPP